jgi:hypothetical protein
MHRICCRAAGGTNRYCQQNQEYSIHLAIPSIQFYQEDYNFIFAIKHFQSQVGIVVGEKAVERRSFRSYYNSRYVFENLLGDQ